MVGWKCGLGCISPIKRPRTANFSPTFPHLSTFPALLAWDLNLHCYNVVRFAALVPREMKSQNGVRSSIWFHLTSGSFCFFRNRFNHRPLNQKKQQSVCCKVRRCWFFHVFPRLGYIFLLTFKKQG